MRGSLLEALVRLLEGSGVDLASWGLAFARVLPVLVIVPAFGLRALSAPVRAAAALVLSAIIVPALPTAGGAALPWPPLLLFEFARGTLIAIAAALPLWSATMAGGIVDALRGAQEQIDAPTVEGRPSPLGALFALLAATIFLGTGGPARLVGILVSPAPSLESGLVRAAANLAAGIGFATAVAAPLLAASLIFELAGALVARAASPAHLSALLAPVRSLALLALTAIFLDRMAVLLALWQM